MRQRPQNSFRQMIVHKSEQVNTMHAVKKQQSAISLLMFALLVSCSQPPEGDNEAQGQNLSTASETSEDTLTNAAPPLGVDEVDPSDERLNRPGAGRDLTLAVKDDPAVMDALVGSWAMSKEGCNSGEAIGFFPDGTYGLEGEGGQWVLAGDILRFEAVKFFELGVEGETSATRDPVKLLAIDATSMRWQYGDGVRSKFVRCPPDR